MCTQATHKYTLTHTDLCILQAQIHIYTDIYRCMKTTHAHTKTPTHPCKQVPQTSLSTLPGPHGEPHPQEVSLTLSLTTQGSLPSEPSLQSQLPASSSSDPSWSPAWDELRAGTLFCLSDPRTEKMEEAGRPGAGEPALEPPGCTRPDLGPMPLRERGSSLLRPWPLQGGEGGWGQERGCRMEGSEEDSLP